MDNKEKISNASFLRWMKPILEALKTLGGSAKPAEVRDCIINAENISKEELEAVRGKTKVNKFQNELAFARNYLVYAGYIDNAVRGVWKLTELGATINMTDEMASNIFKEYRQKIKKDDLLDVNFEWIDFYMELADKLLKYKNNKQDLLVILEEIYHNLNFNYPFKEKGTNKYEDICPFTVFGAFNKNITTANRVLLLKEFAKQFDVKAKVPTEFKGIPVVMNLSAWFFAYKENRGVHDIDNLWELLEKAINYAEDNSETNRAEFINIYNQVCKQKGVKWNITMGLYWVRPYSFINLDSTNRTFITDKSKVSSEIVDLFKNINVGLPDGTSYLDLCNKMNCLLNDDEYLYHSFPELSYWAWKSLFATEKDNVSTASIDSNVNEVSYWVYSPGENACMWDEFSANGIMGIGWDKIGDLSAYQTKEEIKAKMKDTYDDGLTYKNDVHCLWQFSKEMKVGDVVFAKRGLHKIIGKGIVESDYIYDANRDTYKQIRKVNWQLIGEWDYSGNTAVKTLTNITAYPDYVKELLELLSDGTGNGIEEVTSVVHPTYTKEDFLDQVYIDEQAYDTLVNILNLKYNIILQGAPGVGKTYAAKRLAYSIMGEKDSSRVCMVQFHQSYSYEDFIQGYRPVENGFKLTQGIFYKFCKEAEIDNERPYFFIIDEINRGNLSKIFGELMMLIEKDKRGEKLKLLYNDEWFTVPKNIRIIGMMNTADRSLAMMDYALRRRFSFYEIKPAFSSAGFKTYQLDKNNEKFDKLISVIENLNDAIAEDGSLGEGFRIGHSYFCTDEEITDDWLNAVVEYEIIPLLQEYWYDEPSKVRNWSTTLRGAIK